MKSSFKNIKPYKWLVQTFESWMDALSFAADKLLSGLFGGLFLILLSLMSAQAQSPYTMLLKSEKSPYDTAVAIEIKTYRIETTKLRFADIVIDSLSSENVSLRKEIDAADTVMKWQAVTITTQDDLIQKSETRWTDLNSNYQQIFKLIQEKDEPEKWYKNKYLWIGAAFVSGVLIAR